MINELNIQQLYVDSKDYKASFQKNETVTMEFVVLTPKVERQFSKILRYFLMRLDIIFLKDPIFTILKELITNASKANAKRLYFSKHKLDINDKDDYIKGMDHFKEEALLKNSDIFNEMINTEYRVKVVFHNANIPKISVINNNMIIQEELYKIDARLKKAYKYNDITEAFEDVLDDSEGAGLGLIMAMMIFKNSGFNKDDFVIANNDGSTEFSISIGSLPPKEELGNKISEEITSAIDILPSFREHIAKISALCDTHDVSIAELAELIKMDPSLTTSLLKRANSAGYYTSQRVNSIEDAIKNIGLQGIKVLTTAAGIDDIVEQKFSEFKSIWAESYKKAYYAQRLAIFYKLNKLADTAFLAGLLSKIGKILLLSVNKTVVENISKISGLKDISNTDVIEEISIGISHSTLGGIITRKWQFDESLSTAIEYHTKPHIAPEEYIVLTYIVYLACVLAENDDLRGSSNIDDEVYDFFKIKNDKSIEAVHSLIKTEYEKKIAADGEIAV